MMNLEEKEILSSIKTTQYGAVLKKFLEEEYKKIGDITKAENWEETRGRQVALALLKDLFSFLEEKKFDTKSKNIYE